MSADVPFDDDDDLPRPWEEPGAVRRDCAPHRGRPLLFLGRAAFACGLVCLVMTVPCCFTLPGAAFAYRRPLRVSLLMTAASSLPCLFAWVLAVAARKLARRDLARMEAGLMDPAGRGDTEGARAWAAWGWFLALPGTLLALSALAALCR
jgi:hypothetical protein